MVRPVRAESRWRFESASVLQNASGGRSAQTRVFALERNTRHQSTAKAILCDTLKDPYRRAALGRSRKPCQSQSLCSAIRALTKKHAVAAQV